MTVKELRDRLELTQQDFATLLGVSLTTVRLWEYGTVRPSRMARERIGKFLKSRGIDDEELTRWARIR
jgi:putative transcriptional regulator